MKQPRIKHGCLTDKFSFYSSSFGSFLYSEKYMVVYAASPPKTFEIGSAEKTPFTPIPILGRIIVSGMTIIAFLRSEKKTARFGHLSETNVDWPADWNVWNTKVRK